MATCLMTVSGVLRGPSGQPITEGVRLYTALAETYRVALASDDVDDDTMWLQIEGLRQHQQIVGDTPGYLRGSDRLLSQVDWLLGKGHDLTLVVDPNPSNIAKMLHKGVVSMLFAQPKYARPEFRPDFKHQVKPWAEMVAEIETQALLEQQPRRTSEDD